MTIRRKKLTFREKRRRGYLERSGFLLFEADDLCVIPGYVPYFKRLVRERRALLKEWLGAGYTMPQWELRLQRLYRDNKWVVFIDGLPKADPWKLLRAFEDDYRDHNPEYDSPWQKKKRRPRDFLPKIERTMARQRGMA